MTQLVRIVVPGRLGGKGRPRFAVRGGYARAYTPEKTRNQEAMLRTLAAQAMGAQSLLEGPLSVHIEIVQQPPQSWSKKKQASAKWISGKPDADNVIKIIGDSLNGIVWRDDSQIAKLQFVRHYALDETERAIIIVSPLTEHGSPTITYSQSEAA